MKAQDKRITIRIDDQTLEALKKMAKEQHLPYQTFLKVLIKRTLALNIKK